MKPKFLLLCASAFALQACNTGGGGNDTEIVAGSEIGIDVAAMDTSVKPGDDFFSYANGSWVKNNEIPADRGSIGGFTIAFDSTEAQLAAIMKNVLEKDHPAGSDAAKIKAYYNAYVDQAAIDARGLEPLKADFARFASIKSRTDLARVLGEQMQVDVDPLNNTNYNTENLFGMFVTQGLATAGETLPYLLQGGLGLPDRDYYLSNDSEMASIRKDYRAYVEQIFKLAGMDNAAARAGRVYDLELKIARAHVGREVSEDMAQGGTVWTRADLKAKAPGVEWDTLLDAAGLKGRNRFDAYQPAGISGLAKLVASEPIAAWQDWLAFHQINSHASVLPSAIDKASFAFYGTRINGTPEMRPRDKRALGALQADLGYALGKLYVDRNFSPAAKADIENMVENIKTALAKRVEKIDWMDPSTKEEAIKKATGMAVAVGYPDNWPNYDSLDIGDNAYANRVNAEKAETKRQLAKLDQPIDRKEWWMVPQLVNAVNLPVQNAMNFPAAILQRPFYDPKADAAYNYGAIGAVIGHEVSHSFDNNGALFDDKGLLRNWWTASDLAKFNEAGDALAKQYDQYSPFEGVHLNGKLMLGENIADVAGLAAAYDAYHASLGGKEAPVIDGYTGDQRFFIAYAQAWATKMREGLLRTLVATDGHAPGMYRALTVRNLDAWYDAFDVKPGDKLYLKPEDRVRVW